MQIYLPIAEMSVPAESLAILGIAVGFLSGVFGVGGGFLATPFLLFMGIPPAIAVGTQANQLIATSMTGVLGHWRKGNVDAHLGGVMAGGGLVGTVVGIFLFRILQHFGQIDLFIAAAYVVLLGSIGVMMLIESIAAMLNHSKVTDVQALSQREFFRNLPYKMRFNKSRRRATLSSAPPLRRMVTRPLAFTWLNELWPFSACSRYACQEMSAGSSLTGRSGRASGVMRW